MSMPADALKPDATLAALLAGIAAAPPVPIAGIASDSRRLRAGDVFLALPGARSHGLDFAAEAIAGGAAAIVWDADEGGDAAPAGDVPAVAVPGLAARLPDIANRWFDTPSAALRVLGVTGTNGKTTVAWLIAQCLRRLGRPCAYLGTLGAGMNELDASDRLTTPDCVELQRRLAAFRDAGAVYAALEVSSHGLEQGRVGGTRFDTAVFTNLSRDHMDYHGDMDAYGEAKARLFLEFAPAHRVVCVDTAFGRELAARCGGGVTRVATTPLETGRDPAGAWHVVVDGAAPRAGGIEMRVRSSWGSGRCRLPLYGAFNVANAAEVLAVLLCQGVAFDDALAVLAGVTAPPGRLQRVAAPAGNAAEVCPEVFVDYAHTPAALEAALEALRAHCRGRLWCVFGCGGERDRGKRPAMGRIAARLADRPVVTSDNPRTESAAAIIGEILAGMPGDAVALEDRAAAIAWTLAAAGADDVVLIAGKGHEDYQQIGTRRVPFSDYQLAAAALGARGAPPAQR